MTITNVFVETRFPVDISYNSQGGPRFNTTIFTSSSGREQRNINWSLSRAEYDVGYGIKTNTQMAVVLEFFYAMMGKAYAFRYKDWSDFQIQNQVIATGNGILTTFQIVKSYSDPNDLQTFVRPIRKPVNGSLTAVMVNNVIVSGSTYSIDYTTGLITFTVAPANTYPIEIVYLEFDVPVRFDTDIATIRFDFYNVESWEGIKIVEVKLQ